MPSLTPEFEAELRRRASLDTQVLLAEVDRLRDKVGKLRSDLHEALTGGQRNRLDEPMQREES